MSSIKDRIQEQYKTWNSNKFQTSKYPREKLYPTSSISDIMCEKDVKILLLKQQ